MDSTHIFHSAFRIDFKVVQFEGYKNGMLKHRIQIRKRIKYHIMSATHIRACIWFRVLIYDTALKA